MTVASGASPRARLPKTRRFRTQSCGWPAAGPPDAVALRPPSAVLGSVRAAPIGWISTLSRVACRRDKPLEVRQRRLPPSARAPLTDGPAPPRPSKQQTAPRSASTPRMSGSST